MTSVKQTKKLTIVSSVILLVTLVAVLLISALAAGAVAAEEITVPNISASENEGGEKYMDIVASNLLYDSYLYIFYAVDLNLDADMDAQNIKMMFWSSPAEKYEIDSEQIIYISKIDGDKNLLGQEVTVNGDRVYSDCAVFASMGIPAKQIGDTFYARAAITDPDGNVYYSNVVKYSVFEYVQSRFEDKDNGLDVTDAQIKLYNKILEYGKSAQLQFKYRTDRLVTDPVAKVTVSGGHMIDGFTSGHYLVGDKITLVADMPGDKYFSHWENSKGEIVSSDRLYTLRVTDDSDKEVYTAVYGDYNPTAEVLPVKGGANGIVSIVHDDGNISTVYNLEKIFYKHGIVGNLALMSEHSKTTGNLAKWKEILTTERWKVMSHSATHTWWGTATDNGDGTYTFADNQTKVENEIVNSQKKLREFFPGQRVLAFAYPGFATEKNTYVGAYAPAMGTDKYNKILEFIYSPASRELIADTYVVARYDSILTGNEAYVDNIRDFYYMNGGFISTANYNNGNILTRLEDAANGGFHLFSLHTCTDDGEITPAAMDGVCELLAKYVAEGKIWNAFYEDAALYVKEAQNSKVEITGNSLSLSVNLTDTLDNDIYNYPLTVRISAPKDWAACKIVQGDNTYYVAVETVNGNRVIDADLVPDGGVATITPASLDDVPEVEETTPALPIGPDGPFDPDAPAEDEEEENTDNDYTSNPNLALDTFLDFETDPGIIATGTATVAFGERDNGKTLKMLDATSSQGHWTVPFGKSVSAQRFIFTFDVNVVSASAGFNTTFYFADSPNSPYMLYLNAASGSYSFGDCQSNAGGAGVTTANLTGTLSYNTWYTIKIDVDITGENGFLTTWYVKDSTGKFQETGTSANFCNPTKSSTATPATTVSYFKASSLTSATAEMYFDNMIMQAGTHAGFEAAVPSIDMSYNFDSSTQGITSSSPVTYTSEKPTADAETNALCINKTATGYKQLSLSASSAVSNAASFVLEFDLNVASASGTVMQLAFNSTLGSTPYDLTIVGSSSGYNIGDLSNASGGTATTITSTALEYGKTYSVKLVVTLGDKDAFLSTLYIDGEKAGTSTNYYKVNGSTDDPHLGVNGLYFHWQNSSTFKMYIDNLSLRVYEPVVEEEDLFPADSEVKEGYVSFTGEDDIYFYEGKAHSVKDGKLYTNDPTSWSATTFNYDGYSSRKTYSVGTKYIFEAEYTYLGGSIPTDTSGIAFVGFLNAAADNNSYMWVSDKIVYGADANSDGVPDSVSFFSKTFELGKTYSIKLVQTTGTTNVDVYVDGTLSHTYKGSVATTLKITSDNVFYGFGVYYRSTERTAGYQCCWDNVKVSYEGEEIVEEVEYGEVLENGHRVDVNFFPGFVRKTVSFTLDDGYYQYDKKVVDILKPYGFTGTFNINNPASVTDPSIYEGFEIANHHILHAVAEKDAYAEREKVDSYLPSDADTTKVYLRAQTVDGKQVEGLYYVYIGGSWHPMASDETYIKYLEWTTKELEKIFGEGSVVGFAYPHGNQYNDAIIAYLKEAGYLYGRRTGNLKAATNFALPDDRYTWTYNADHGCLLEVMRAFDRYEDDGELKMFSFGVHAKDFETANKWGDLETFAELYGNRPEDFWYATNRQIFEYEDAINALEITNEKIVNNSDIDLYIKIDGVEVILKAKSEYIFGELPEGDNEEIVSDPVIEKSFSFASADDVSVSNSASKASSESGVLTLEKNSGYNEFKMSLGATSSSASKIVAEFKIMVPKTDNHTTGVVQHMYFDDSKSPYIMIINASTDIYYLGDKTALGGGTRQDLFEMQYDVWYTVKVTVDIGQGTLNASWVVTDANGVERTASSTAANSSYEPTPTASCFMLAAPKAAVITVKLSDLTVKVYE